MKIDIGKALRILRKQKCFSQQDISDYLNVSRSTYSAWENNNREIPFSKILLLLKHYDIAMPYFLELSNVSTLTDDIDLIDIYKEIHLLKQEFLKLSK